MFRECVSAAATAALVQGGRGRGGGGPSRGMAPEAPADPRRHQADGGAVPPQEEHHGQPI